jgi:hypothetical protein
MSCKSRCAKQGSVKSNRKKRIEHEGTESTEEKNEEFE